MLNLNINIVGDDVVRKSYMTHQNYSNDSGFDLFVAQDVLFTYKESTRLVPLGIRAAPDFNSGYYLYPRSSIFKTKFRLANSVGIIDMNYRGEIRAAVDAIITPGETLVLRKNTRLFQLCHPSLQPMNISFIDNERFESLESDRAERGFGSSG